MVNSRDVSAVVATRARIVLWMAEGRMRKDVAELAGVHTPEVRAWLAGNPNVTFHFIPVGSSWVNQIETWFGIITKQAIHPPRHVHLDQRPDPPHP